jgi:ABC-type polysaccharide/polyol phosphate transport system ATPase subunit
VATILVESVDLEFPIYGMQRSFRRALFQRAAGGLITKKDLQHRQVTVTALSGISLELNDGDRLGLIGHNGAGKSSLLKVLAGVYQPTRGQVWVDGNITSLFELALGIDAEDTGYEAITTAGMLHGMTRAEIESNVPEIERFSQLGEYLSLPTKTYSAGMVARLGFSLATTLKPEIILVDEGIGAGDASFSERAVEKMKELISGSNILVLASHSEDLIASLCNRAVLMQSGAIVEMGSVPEILEKYRECRGLTIASDKA